LGGTPLGDTSLGGSYLKRAYKQDKYREKNWTKLHILISSKPLKSKENTKCPTKFTFAAAKPA
jgi:hypothetical protein